MPKTVIEKSPSPSPDVTVFSVSGTLGYHEKDTLEKLFEECRKRSITKIVLDVSNLTSLGGGCAKIIESVASSGTIALGMTGAKATVLKFLKDADQLLVADSLESAVAGLSTGGVQPASDQPEPAWSAAAPSPPNRFAPDNTPRIPDDRVIILGLDPVAGQDQTPVLPASPGDDREGSTEATPRAREPEPVQGESEQSIDADHGSNLVDPRELQKRIVQYNTVFSLNTDFYRLQDRKNLLELFLLSTIAQVGVESAVFLEYREGFFTPASAKGLEADDLRGFALPAEQLDLESWKETLAIYPVEGAPFSDEVKAPLLSLGCAYVAPFVAHDEFRGIVTLGKPLKSDLDEPTIGFLKMLINQAALAYESTQRFEEEKQRTLGLVQTLIALIEENTLARGNTTLLSSYTYLLAKNLHYPEEHIRDLIYGTVLRDIGMIKVSDLIVRSPRELMPEEWEIIKRHPIDGAEMLRNMKFSEHAVSVVLAHHERFNGEGYPKGLQGKQIPMGARIVAIVESYAAMLQERPTRPALTKEEALNTLKENWGNRYDPDVVRAFVEVVENELRSGQNVVAGKFELFNV